MIFALRESHGSERLSSMSDALICNPLYRADDPSFNSALPLSARFLFVKKGVDQTWIWGGSGSLLIRLAWEQFLMTLPVEPMELGRLEVYGASGSNRRRSYHMELGSASWNENFTRALWAWLFRAWDAQTRRMRLPSALDQFLGRASTDNTAAWMTKLRAVESVESSRTVSATALRLACLAALDRQGLVDNVTTPLVSLYSQSSLPRFGVEQPSVTAIPRANNEAVIWRVSTELATGFWVRSDGSTSAIECAASSAPPSSPAASRPAAPRPSAPPPTSARAPATQPSLPAAPPTTTSPEVSPAIEASVIGAFSEQAIPVLYAFGGALVLGGLAWSAFSAFRSSSDSSPD